MARSYEEEIQLIQRHYKDLLADGKSSAIAAYLSLFGISRETLLRLQEEITQLEQERQAIRPPN